MARKKQQEQEEIEVIASSGNVYADTGHPNPEEAMAKAELAILISNAIKRKKLTQKKAAELIGVDQPKVTCRAVPINSANNGDQARSKVYKIVNQIYMKDAEQIPIWCIFWQKSKNTDNYKNQT